MFDNLLKDGGEVVSLPPWYSFLLETGQPQGHSATGRIV
jgi:hypothetical protein